MSKMPGWPSNWLRLFGLLLAFAPLVVVAALLVLLDDTSGESFDPQEQFEPGESWSGQGGQGISQAEAEQFAGYPLLWLGASYERYHLHDIILSRYDAPPGAPAGEAGDSVTIIYGDCRILGNATSCSPPITLRIEPVCAKRPEMLAGATPDGNVRGEALRYRFPRYSGLVLWTDEMSVRVIAPVDAALPDRIVRDLHGLNDIATGIEPGSPLPAPDFSACGPLPEDLIPQ